MYVSKRYLEEKVSKLESAIKQLRHDMEESDTDNLSDKIDDYTKCEIAENAYMILKEIDGLSYFENMN